MFKIKNRGINPMQVKGTVIVFLPTFMKEKFGAAKYEEWKAALPPKSQAIYNKQILASAWYPLEDAFNVPLSKICEMFYNNNPKEVWNIGRYSADFGLKGVYKILIRLGSPEALAKRASSVIEKYYQPSKIECHKVPLLEYSHRVPNRRVHGEGNRA